AAATRAIDLIVISTNEVFDGQVPDHGRGYWPSDRPDPINAYGRSKRAGEQQAVEAYRVTAANLGIVRTAWLYGPPGNDFPAKILAAAERVQASGEPLKLVADEIGSPTLTTDLAEGIVELIGGDGEIDGLHHIVNGGRAS